MDHADEAIREATPWLYTQTSDDLVQYFERHRDCRRHHGQLPEWWDRWVV